MKLEKSVFNPYSISASDNAFIEENEARERDARKKEKVEKFLSETKQKVKLRETKDKEERL